MFGFCETCRNMMPYKVKKVDSIGRIKGEEVEYKKKIAFCEECEHEIFIHDLRDDNLEEIDRVYRTEREIILVSDIEEILSKYDIGKRPLSNLLGWAELTITRYLEGQIPTKEYSDKLNELLIPKNMESILEKNKENITQSAYDKVKSRLEEILSDELMDLENKSKLEIVSEYILMKSGDITPLALQKLLYYAQGFSLTFRDKLLFEENCEAWVHGPVYRDIYFKYESYSYDRIDYSKIDETVFKEYLNSDELDLLDVIISYFGKYSGKVLEEMTHYEEPWKNAREGLRPRQRSNNIIEVEDIKSYFDRVKETYRMISILDIRDYSSSMSKKVLMLSN